jgi:hypothetical protein
MPGFARPIESPMILNLGAGWIPNRFATAGFSIAAVGSTRNTALLLDDDTLVGRSFTLQPRVGVSYVLGQWEFIRLTGAAGGYYEVSRIAGNANRLHGTGALNANIYFVNAGIGVDRAERYNNFFVSVGFDIVRTLRTFGIIPKDSVPPYNGFFPSATAVQSDGLPDGLTYGERKKYAAPSVGDVAEIIEQIPENIGNKLIGEPTIPEMEEKRKEDARKNPAPPKKKGKRKKREAAKPAVPTG